MRPDLLEGVRTLRWSGLHPSHASGITDTLIGLCQADASCRRGTTEDAAPPGVDLEAFRVMSVGRTGLTVRPWSATVLGRSVVDRPCCGAHLGDGAAHPWRAIRAACVNRGGVCSDN